MEIDCITLTTLVLSPSIDPLHPPTDNDLGYVTEVLLCAIYIILFKI